MSDTSKSDTDWSDQLFALIDAARTRAANVARSAAADPLGTGGDLLRGAAGGLAQAPFDFGSFIAPGLGLIAPVGASVLPQLADRTQAFIDRSPIAARGDAGALGALLSQLAIPLPGQAAKGGVSSLSELARLIQR